MKQIKLEAVDIYICITYMLAYTYVYVYSTIMYTSANYVLHHKFITIMHLDKI